MAGKVYRDVATPARDSVHKKCFLSEKEAKKDSAHTTKTSAVYEIQNILLVKTH